MNQTLLKHSIVVAALLAFPLAQAATMTKADHSAAKSRIGATYKADKAACASLTANAKDVCIEQAKGKEKVARAELEYAYQATTKNQNKVLVAKAEAAYAVAKEKCDDLSGNAKDVCVKQAKAIEAKALAEAKVGKEVNAAITDAAKDMAEAKYKLAAEKCESLTGDAKAGCIAAAKAAAGKS
ncbi:MAG TPA: hypothetical protein VFQ20_07370 [Burkholderiaceae bacterium]|nr:hypothetical protein [Burkholderiaceae bacterium]